MRFLRRPIDDLWIVLALVLPPLAAIATPIPTVDIAYLVRTGDLILSRGAIPSTDPFTFSAAGHEWIVQQWGAAVAIALAFRPVGWIGLTVLEALIVFSTFGLVLLTLRRAGVRPRAAALLTLGPLFILLPALGMRPQLFGMLFFAATLAILGERARSPRLMFLVPALVVLWANVHGTFPIGLAAVGWALLEDVAESRRAATPGRRARAVRIDVVVLLLSLVATLVNPYGPRIWAYVVGIASNSSVTGLVTEWRPPELASYVGVLFYGSALLVALLVGARWRQTTWPTRLWLLGLVALGAWSLRGLQWWALGSVVAVAPLFARRDPAQAPVPGSAVATTDVAPGLAGPAAAVTPGGGGAGDTRGAPAMPVPPRSRPRAVNGVLIVILACLPFLLLTVIAAGPRDPLAGPDLALSFAPSGLATALRASVKPGDRVFDRQVWGSWFEWAVPDALMFTDSRFEVIPDAAWKDYLSISSGRFDWAQSLDRIGADIIVASREDQKGLLAAIAAAPSSGWRQVYADADGVILTR